MNIPLTSNPNNHLDEEELKHIVFLAKHNRELLPIYIKNIKKARKEILNRFVSAMFREDIMGFYHRSVDLRKVGSRIRIKISSIDEHWNSIFKKINDCPLENEVTYKVYATDEYECLLIPVKRIYAFRRVIIGGDIYKIGKKDVKKIQSVSELFDIFREQHNDRYFWNGLEKELINGSANLALAYTFAEKRTKHIRKKSASKGLSNSLEFIKSKMKENDHFSGSLFFEQLCTEGHLLHPGAKTKMGMLPKDVYQYAPDCKGEARIRFVAVHRRYIEWNTIDGKHPNETLFSYYADLQTAFFQQCIQNQMNPNNYILIPVHPWQLEVIIPTMYEIELAKKIIIPIDKFSVKCLATSSFRTLVPEKKGKIAFKVAVHSQMTSTVRSISAHTAHNAVPFSKLMREIMKRENTLCNIFQPVYELAGYHFKAPSESLKSRNLTAILREDIDHLVKPDETAVVGSSLYSLSPITNKPVLMELIELFSITSGEQSIKKAAILFLSEYTKILLRGYLTLMIKYGIGLEGHLQNSIPVFKRGKPMKLLYRDWGGIRIFPKRLKKQGLDIRLYPGSVTITNSLREFQNKVFYTVFQNHLGELILQIHQFFSVNERRLWQEIRMICDNIFNELEQDVSLFQHIAEDKKTLYESTIEHKALTKMRLVSENGDYLYVHVPNPLCIDTKETMDPWNN